MTVVRAVSRRMLLNWGGALAAVVVAGRKPKAKPGTYQNAYSNTY